ncbi:phage/plasmid primase, P4 family [Streptomyces sp. NPDC127061]|uniref:phage/plasmid primase, P4 family n=1 Tax=Streptomyces sp. NPDC127061 TaxID=3347122 RepID=UPI0036666EEB
MKFPDLIEKFGPGVVEEADGYVVRCPAHGDSKPSLKVTLKDDGRVLVVCRAGCTQPDVLSALKEKYGITRADLRGVEAGEGTRTISAARPDAVGPGEVAGLRVFVDEASAALSDSPEAVKYLADRFGLTAEQAEELGVGFAAPGNRPQPWLSRGFTRYPRITVPLYGADGVARGLQGRDISKKCPARWVSLANPDGRTWAKWGFLSAGTGYDTILVTEGPGDGLTSVGVGYDALIIRGAGVARNAALVAELVGVLRGRDVVFAFDPDDAGARGIAVLAEALTKDGNAPRQLAFPNAREDLTAWRERTPETFARELHTAVRSAPVFVLGEPTPAPEAPAPATAGPTDLVVAEDARAAFDATDVGLAIRLRDHMNGGIKWAAGLGFMVWNGRFWEPGDARVRQALHHMGAALLASGKDYERKLALRALTSRSITDIMEELPSVPGVRAEADAFDRSPDLLSVANGTLNLKTGVLGPHDPDDLITQCLDVEYDPGAECARWLAFLDEVFPNHPDMPAYIRRLVGYGLTGYTSEQVFVFHHGGGKNGKSVYLDTLLSVFRGVARSTEFTTFEQRTGIGQASPEVAGLRGYRMVMASETEKYNRLAESLVKQLTGGDAITARFLHQNPFTFTPRFLLQVAGNYKPAIVSQDYGIWRRVKLIPWEATFNGSQQDSHLPAKLRGEAAGILAWAVRGAQEWAATGLGEPTTVVEATQDYRESEDRLAEFIETALVVESGATITPTELRTTYQQWAQDSGLTSKETLAGWSISVEMESRGYPKKRTASRRFHEGIRLRTDSERHRANASEIATQITGAGDSTASADIFGQAKGSA